MMDERARADAVSDAVVIRGARLDERAEARGRYLVECFDVNGKLKWKDVVENVVATIGKNLMLDTAFAGSGYSVTGPFIGLISSTSFTAVAASDTMSSHPGWLEAGGVNSPTYTGTRKTAVWSPAAAGTKALSATLSFAITSSGIVKGLFTCFGTGAVNTKDNSSGTLWSAGAFTTGDKPVSNGDTLACTYSTSL